VLREKYPKLNIQVDGGINEKTLISSYEAGANSFVAGSYIFQSEDREKTIKSMKLNLE
jgi:ribulose-phosphate 3-epimerase